VPVLDIGSPRVRSSLPLPAKLTWVELSLEHAERSDSSVEVLLSPCPSILPSPSLTGWTAFVWGCTSAGVLFRATHAGACYRAEYGYCVEGGVRKRLPRRMTSRLTLWAIRPKLIALRLATSHLFQNKKAAYNCVRSEPCLISLPRKH